MKFLKILLSSVGIAGVGIATVLLCLPASAQTQSKSSLPSTTPLMGKSSSLGGPITPTQPDFFADATYLSISAASADSAGTISAEPLTRSADRRPAPMVGDPPRPVGGFLKVELD